MPATTCAQVLDLTPHDVEQIRALGDGSINREACQKWLDTHAGDFQAIEDFHADIEDFDSPWEKEENEFTFNDCMFPDDL